MQPYKVGRTIMERTGVDVLEQNLKGADPMQRLDVFISVVILANAFYVGIQAQCLLLPGQPWVARGPWAATAFCSAEFARAFLFKCCEILSLRRPKTTESTAFPARAPCRSARGGTWPSRSAMRRGTS